MTDSHVHLQDFISPENITVYLKTLYSLGVDRVLCVSYDTDSSRKATELLNAYRETLNGPGAGCLQDALSMPGTGTSSTGETTMDFHIAAGIHPQYISDDPDKHVLRLREILDEHPEISCIGEIGLDYRKGMPDRELQKTYFKKQLELSLEYDLPVSIHSVSACSDTLNMLKACPGVKGIMHGYAYSAEAAREFIRAGFDIGVGATLLRPSARKLPETVRSVPREHLVTETDLPFSFRAESFIPASDGNGSPECRYFTSCSTEEIAGIHADMLRRINSLF